MTEPVTKGNRKRNDKSNVRHPAGKFLIGFFAAFCGYVAPLIAPLLSEGDLTQAGRLMQSGIDPWTIAGIGLGWCLVIGGVMTVLEWWTPRNPADTFIRAFGIPAMLAGAVVSTGQTFDKSARLEKAKAQIDERLAESAKLIREWPKEDKDALIRLMVSGRLSAVSTQLPAASEQLILPPGQALPQPSRAPSR